MRQSFEDLSSIAFRSQVRSRSDPGSIEEPQDPKQSDQVDQMNEGVSAARVH